MTNRRSRRRRSPESDVEGVLIVDKPAGPTSHDVVQQVRRTVGQSRIGHTGTLDPAATGVLVLCLGRATKLVQFLQAGTKTYAARMVLGVETDSQDADGQIVARADASHIDERVLCEALTRFQGALTQIPPMVSAVKIDGERLHHKARRGETVVREPRHVTVHGLVLDGFTPGARAEASFLVTCSAGTYVRTLAHDIGQELGVGGSLIALRRVANGPFVEDEAHAVGAIEGLAAAQLDALLVDPADAVARALPIHEVDREEAARLVHGGKLASTPSAPDGPFGVMCAGQLIGIYALTDPGGPARAQLVWTRPEELR